MKEGDLLHIKGQNDDGTISTWYGELVGIDEEGMLEVFYLEKTALCGGYIWSYKRDWETISADSVMQIFTPTKENYLPVLREFGFHATIEENQFLRASDEIPSTIVVPMILDSDTESVHDGDTELADFIVDDDVANEPFTHACPSSEFVRETHKAVNDYNQWVPKSVEETRVKQFIDNMSARYQVDDDNRHFANGDHVDYLHPRVSQ